MTEANKEYCHHAWESGSAWGVIVGVSKCTRCGRVSRTDDFPSPDETVARQFSQDEWDGIISKSINPPHPAWGFAAKSKAESER